MGGNHTKGQNRRDFTATCKAIEEQQNAPGDAIKSEDDVAKYCGIALWQDRAFLALRTRETKGAKQKKQTGPLWSWLKNSDALVSNLDLPVGEHDHLEVVEVTPAYAEKVSNLIPKGDRGWRVRELGEWEEGSEIYTQLLPATPEHEKLHPDESLHKGKHSSSLNGHKHNGYGLNGDAPSARIEEAVIKSLQRSAFDNFMGKLASVGVLGRLDMGMTSMPAAMYFANTEDAHAAYRFILGAEIHPEKYGVPADLHRSGVAARKFSGGYAPIKRYELGENAVYELKLQPDVARIVREKSPAEVIYMPPIEKNDEDAWKTLAVSAAEKLRQVGQGKLQGSLASEIGFPDPTNGKA